MANDIFAETVRITNSSGGLTVFVDGKTGSVSVGGGARPPLIPLPVGGGGPTIDGPGVVPFLAALPGTPQDEIEKGHVGSLTVNDSFGHPMVEIGAGDGGTIKINNRKGLPQLLFDTKTDPTFVIGGNQGNVTVSASSTGGLVVANYNNGEPCLALGRGFNGDAGPSLFMLGQHGETSVRLRGLDAYFALGGGALNPNVGADGEIALFTKDAVSPDPHNAMISLRAHDASIRAGGKQNDGFTSGIDGRILVLDKEGKAKIRLEGSSGDIFLSGADCAEDFDLALAEQVDPGAVMVLNDFGELHASSQAYDRKVVGVVSGAGTYKPGIVLDKQESKTGRTPLSLVGKAYCKVDAEYAPVEVGDLLTTSDTPGHAMKAIDTSRAFGAVIGKALRRLDKGQGLIPILVALQ